VAVGWTDQGVRDLVQDRLADLTRREQRRQRPTQPDLASIEPAHARPGLGAVDNDAPLVEAVPAENLVREAYRFIDVHGAPAGSKGTISLTLERPADETAPRRPSPVDYSSKLEA
jgi:hypothetical protein